MFTPIEIDKGRNLRYGMKALSLIEKKFKKPLSSIDFENMTIEETVIIIWAGLVHEDPGLSPDKLLDLIDQSGIKMDTLANAMTEALNEAFGEPEPNPPTAEEA